MSYVSIYEVMPLSRNTIRQFTKDIRQICNIDTPSFPIMRFLESIVFKMGVNFDIIDEQEWIKDFGYSKWAVYNLEEKTIYIRESVYDNACNGIGQDRYTVAHEIGHMLLLNPKHIKVARSSRTVSTACNPEWQADCFAGELLVPEHLCRDMSVEEIIAQCGVSRKAAEYQKSKF